MSVRLMLLHRMALVFVRLFCKKLGNLQEFFGQMVYPPPPLGKKLPVRLCATVSCSRYILKKWVHVVHYVLSATAKIKTKTMLSLFD